MSSTMTKAIRAALIVIAGMLITGATPAAATASASADLIVAEPEVIAVSVPAPGHALSAATSITNIAPQNQDVEIWLEVSAPRSDVLSRDGSPLSVRLEVDGEVHGEPASIDTLTSSPVSLGTLAPGARIDVRAVLEMDRAATNEYAGLSSEALFHFTAQADESTAPGGLAVTGGAIPVIALAAALVLVCGGVALALGRRRLNNPEGEGK